MWPDRVSNPEPLALESDALPTALRGPANNHHVHADSYFQWDQEIDHMTQATTVPHTVKNFYRTVSRCPVVQP